jgi:hypothetical protein
MSQSIDLSAVTATTFNGGAVEQINLNGSGIWTMPASGPAGDWLLTVSDPTEGSDTWFGELTAINETANIFAVGSYMVPKVDFFDATTGALLFTKTKEFGGNSNALYRYPVAVDISETHILIGWTSSGAADQGASYLYDLSGNLVTTYLSPIPNYNFGCAVAVDGNIVVIGDGRTEYATGSIDPYGGYSNGRAYIYNTSGTLLHTLTPSSNRSWLRFGADIHVSGDYVLVGNNSTDAFGDGGDYAEVNLFNTSGTRLWTLTSPHPAEINSFGKCMAISGDRIVVSTNSNIGGTHARLYIYDLAGTLITQVYKGPVGPTGSAGWYGGGSGYIDIDGSTIVLGNNGANSNTGHAFLYNTDGEELKFIEAPTPEAGTGFGRSVAISGNKMVITQRDGFTPYTSARAFIYT